MRITDFPYVLTAMRHSPISIVIMHHSKNITPKMKKLIEYLPSMKLDGYSFKLCQEPVDK